MKAIVIGASKTYVDTKVNEAVIDAGAFSDGGDAAGAPRTLGNTDNESLALLVNNVEQIAITDGVTDVNGVLKINGSDIQSQINPLALSQGVNMTAAASGSNGIQVADNDDINFGTGDFTLVWVGSLPDWTPGFSVYLLQKYQSGGIQLYVTTGKIAVYLRGPGGIIKSYSFLKDDFVNYKIYDICVSVERETSTSDGSISLFIDGVNIQEEIISAGSGGSVDAAGIFYVSGRDDVRTASTTLATYTYNYALDADQVKSLYKNGVAIEDRDGSMTELTSGLLEIGIRYRIVDWITTDDFTNIGGTNEDGNEFEATGTTPTTWTNSSTLLRLGTTLRLEPENIQLSPGQWLNAANNHHAKLPAEGATLIRPQSDGIINWTSTWSASSAGSYIGGINENIFPSQNIRIEWISIQTETTGVNITIGDQTDTDRYVEAVALFEELDISSPVNRNHDGTNLKLVITPSGTYTGSITTTVKYKLIG